MFKRFLALTCLVTCLAASAQETVPVVGEDRDRESRCDSSCHRELQRRTERRAEREARSECRRLLGVAQGLPRCRTSCFPFRVPTGETRNVSCRSECEMTCYLH